MNQGNPYRLWLEPSGGRFTLVVETLVWLLVMTSPVWLALPLLTGCAGSFEESKLAGQQDRKQGATMQPSRCATLESQRSWGHAVSIGSASLAGVSGLSTIKVDDQDKGLRYGLGIGAVGAAALAVGAEAYAQSAGVAWVRECSQ